MSLPISIHWYVAEGNLIKVSLELSSSFHQTWIGGAPIPWVQDWIESYLLKDNKWVDLRKLKIPSPFMEKCFHELQRVSFGNTSTYKGLADLIGCRSPRAIGRAMGANPYPLLLPCHRVVGINGSLTGYAFGLEVKKRLLFHETGISWDEIASSSKRT